MSKDWEHYVSNSIEEVTDDSIRSYRCGYSGSSKWPQPDVLVAEPTMNHAMELKGPIQSDRCYVDEEDIEQLVECQNGYTPVYLVIKFSHRTPMVTRFYDSVDGIDGYDEMSNAEKFAAIIPQSFDPRVTDVGTLALTKPSTDDWPSAQAGPGDVQQILDGLGITTQSSVRIR